MSQEAVEIVLADVKIRWFLLIALSGLNDERGSKSISRCG